MRLRQHDLEGDIFVAPAACAPGGTFAAQSKHGSGVGVLRYRHGHRARRRRHLDLGPEHRFAKRDREVEMDVVALSFEIGMRAHRDLDQGIAGRSAVETRPTLAAQAQYLPIAGPPGDALVEIAVRPHAYFR